MEILHTQLGGSPAIQERFPVSRAEQVQELARAQPNGVLARALRRAEIDANQPDDAFLVVRRGNWKARDGVLTSNR